MTEVRAVVRGFTVVVFIFSLGVLAIPPILLWLWSFLRYVIPGAGLG